MLRCDHAAEDIVQEVFERIWKYAGSFNAQKAQQPRAWIFQIARNQAMNELARLARLEEWPAEDAPASDDVHESNEPLTRAALPLAQSKLPFAYRQVVHLRYHQGLALNEIADHLGIPLGTAKTWLRRALIMMRELMAPEAQLAH